MRFAITTHAIERWQELTDPPLVYAAASAELAEAVGGRPERCGSTRRGQAVFRVEAPRLAFLVVKLGPDKLAKSFSHFTAASGVLVTVLPPAMWERADEVDEARELAEYRASIERPPPAWKPLPPRAAAPTKVSPPPPDMPLMEHEADWRSWAWTCGAIERERRIAEHYRREREEIDGKADIVRAAVALVQGRGTMAQLEAAAAPFLRAPSRGEAP